MLRAAGIAAAAGLACAGGFAASAAEPTPAAAPPATAPTLIEPAAVEPVKRMIQTLGGAKALSYEYESSYDTIQDDGEMLEFGTHGRTTIRRPDRLGGELWSRDGRHVRYGWDGQKVAILDEGKNVYASTPRTGDLDSLIDFLREDVGFRLPVADLFRTDLAAMLVDRVVAARYVGKERIDDEDVDHVALRLRTGIDVQLWVRSGEEAFPRRLVMNFATADGRPSFRAEFSEWKLDPRTRDSAFELDAPKSAKVVPFQLPPNRAAQAPLQEGSR
jgi:hypothetical protein